MLNNVKKFCPVWTNYTKQDRIFFTVVNIITYNVRNEWRVTEVAVYRVRIPAVTVKQTEPLFRSGQTNLIQLCKTKTNNIQLKKKPARHMYCNS